VPCGGLLQECELGAVIGEMGGKEIADRRWRIRESGQGGRVALNSELAGVDELGEEEFEGEIGEVLFVDDGDGGGGRAAERFDERGEFMAVADGGGSHVVEWAAEVGVGAVEMGAEFLKLTEEALKLGLQETGKCVDDGERDGRRF
jgi:hypothetical protein